MEKKPHSKLSEFNFRLVIMLLLTVPIVGYYTYTQVSGNTFFGVSITTNPDLETGLVGHWTFDGPDMNWSSTTAEALDRSGQGNNGNVTNFGSEAAVPGKIGQALEYDGADDRIGISYVPSLNVTDTTFSAWIKAASGGGETQGIIDHGILGAPGGNAGFTLRLDASDQAQWNVADGSGNRITVTATGAGNLSNAWHHVVSTHTLNGTIAVYVDGQFVNSTGITGFTNNTADLAFGAVNTGIIPLEGVVDDVRIYDRVLSAAEITRLYQLGATTHIGTTITTNPDLETGLVGHWTFDGPDMNWSSTTAEALDRSGQGNNGNVTNFGSVGAVPGKIGQALDFDGVDDYVTIPHDSSIDFTDVVSGSVWIKGDQVLDNYSIIISKFANGAHGFELGINDTGPNVCMRIDTDTVNQSMSCNYFLNVIDNTWHNIAFVIDNGTFKAYTDGVLTGNKTYSQTGDFDNVQPLTIGRRADNTNAFNGLIDDVRIYDRALSAAEITRLYQLGATTHIGTTLTTNPDLETGLVGHWTFDGPDMNWSSTTAEALDRSGQGNNGNVTNFGSEGAVPGKIGQALRFDGTGDYINVGNILDAPMEISVSTWVKFSTTSPSALGIFSKGGHGQNGYRLSTNVGQFYWSGKTSGGDTSFDISQRTINIGVWYHAVGTYNGTTAVLYVDGLEVGNDATASGNITSIAANNLIGALFTSCCYVESIIDDVRIYNRALSADEAQRLYEMGR